MNDVNPSPLTASSQSLARRTLMLCIRWGLPLAVLIAAGLGAKQLIDTAPKTPRRQQPRQARLVEVIQITPDTHAITIDTAMGTVRASQHVELRPQVSGRLAWVDTELEPGSLLAAGTPLARIETIDYQLAVEHQEIAVDSAEAEVARAQAAVITARNDLALEMGNQRISKREYELLGETVGQESRDLVLRVPQLKAAEAMVASAEAALRAAKSSLESAKKLLAQTKLDLERTTLKAPFNAVVAEKSVSIGDVVSTTTSLVTLYGTDSFWVELSIPSSELRWVQTGQAGSQVKLTNTRAWGNQAYRMGRVIRRLPTVDTNGRMARLLVQVDDPLSLRGGKKNRPPLLVNDYIHAAITGRSVPDVVSLPRALLREGDAVWVMTPENELEIRRVVPLYRGRDRVLIASQIRSDDRIIVTDIAGPVEGMPLRLEQAGQPGRSEGAEQ